MLYAQVHLTLPAWVHDAVDMGRVYASDAEKVGLAIELSGRNVELASGGPFGAVVFGPDDRIIAVGPTRSTSIPAGSARSDRGRLKAVPRSPAAAMLRPRAPTTSGRRGG